MANTFLAKVMMANSEFNVLSNGMDVYLSLVVNFKYVMNELITRYILHSII